MGDIILNHSLPRVTSEVLEREGDLLCRCGVSGAENKATKLCSSLGTYVMVDVGEGSTF